MNLILNSPNQNILKEWQSLLSDYYDVDFSLEVLSRAYFMDIGYRMGMLEFSPFVNIDRSNSSLIFQKSKKHWEDEDGNLIKDLDTELRESLYEIAY